MRFTDLTRDPSVRRIALDVVAIGTAIVIGLFAFTTFAHGRLDVGPARLVVSVAPTPSALTVVELPPFGSVEADTHTGPVRLSVRLQELDVKGTTRMIERGELPIADALSPPDASEVRLEGLSAVLWRVVGGGLLAAALGGLVAVAAFRRRRWVSVAAVGLAVAVPAAALGVAWATWDISAFREPTLRGSLTYAPQIVDVFSTRVADIERLREQAAKVARDLAGYYADERSLASGGAMAGTYRVLHVTDMHLDPVGAELARSIARSYEASLVVDTGDLPILGAPIETSVFASLIDTATPRVYVPGNHDSPASVAALRRLGVTVVASGTVEVEGMRVFGIEDPVSYGFGVEPDPAPIEAAAGLAADQLADSLRSGETTPDIVAVHNPLMEEPFIGRVPLILSGHTHVARFRVVDGTVVLNSGTIGGMPYDPTSTGRRAMPHTASVLYFTAETPRRLIAVDRIAVYPTRSTTVSRQVIDESLLP